MTANTPRVRRRTKPTAAPATAAVSNATPRSSHNNNRRQLAQGDVEAALHAPQTEVIDHASGKRRCAYRPDQHHSLGGSD